MRHRLISSTGYAVLAAVALLSAGPAAHAQHRGGFSGGAYTGGARVGYGGHYGGYPGHYGGYGHNYGGRYGGYGYYPYGGFGLYLGLGGWGYGGYYPGDYGPAYGYAPMYAPPANYGQPYAGPVETLSAYPPSSAGAARLIVRVPANAKLWVEDYQTTQTGPVRELTTPAILEPGRPYHYTLKAQWEENGKPVTQERTVDFQAGQTATVDFTQPAAAG